LAAFTVDFSQAALVVENKGGPVQAGPPFMFASRAGRPTLN
jgi:hypothetical protein